MHGFRGSPNTFTHIKNKLYSNQRRLREALLGFFRSPFLFGLEILATSLDDNTFVLRAEIATTFGPKMVAISAHNTKVALQESGFASLYFPHFTTFRNQTLQFYSFQYMLILAVVIYLHLLACLVLKLVYNGNCLLAHP